jgi:hypothetical protein
MWTPSYFAFELDAFINAANWTLDDLQTLALTRRAVRAASSAPSHKKRG